MNNNENRSSAFRNAFVNTMMDENGGAKYVLSHLKGDDGEETYAGIARHFHSEWVGWPMVDAGMFGSAELNEAVEDFYYDEFWSEISGDLLGTELAYHVFDFSVNSGVDTAAKCLQRLVQVKVDGKIGAVTAAACGALDEFALCVAYNAQRELYLAGLRGWGLFGAGWINRVAGNTYGMARGRLDLVAAGQAVANLQGQKP